MAGILRIFNVRIGKPDIEMDAPSHVPGVHQGNKEGNTKKERGIVVQNGGARATARRSTGINPDSRNPIDPRMPNLPPS